MPRCQDSSPGSLRARERRGARAVQFLVTFTQQGKRNATRLGRPADAASRARPEDSGCQQKGQRAPAPNLPQRPRPELLRRTPRTAWLSVVIVNLSVFIFPIRNILCFSQFWWKNNSIRTQGLSWAAGLRTRVSAESFAAVSRGRARRAVTPTLGGTPRIVTD